MQQTKEARGRSILNLSMQTRDDTLVVRAEARCSSIGYVRQVALGSPKRHDPRIFFRPHEEDPLSDSRR